MPKESDTSLPCSIMSLRGKIASPRSDSESRSSLLEHITAVAVVWDFFVIHNVTCSVIVPSLRVSAIGPNACRTAFCKLHSGCRSLGFLRDLATQWRRSNTPELFQSPSDCRTTYT